MDIGYKLIRSEILHLDGISSCHINAFPNAIFSKLGPKFLKKMFSWYFESENRLLFHIEHDGHCIGYFGLLINNGKLKMGSTSSIIQYTFSQIITQILLNPRILLHYSFLQNFKLIVRNIKLKMFSSKKNEIIINDNNTDYFPKLGLIVIGLRKEYQGKGVGTYLLKSIDQIAHDLKVKSIYLTVSKSNINAIKSYVNNGYNAKPIRESIYMEKYIL